MRDNTGDSSRATRLNTYVISILLLVAIAVMNVITLNQLSDMSERSVAPIRVEQTDKVKTAAAFLETVGFANPVYLGIKPATEGEFPTFQVEAIGGQPLEVFIHTTQNGGLEIQPMMLSRTVASADEFARLAAEAVFNWENKPPTVQPRTDGTGGEYELLKDNFEQLSKYRADYGYASNQTAGWPRK